MGIAEMMLYVPEDKIEELIQLARRIKQQQPNTTRQEIEQSFRIKMKEQFELVAKPDMGSHELGELAYQCFKKLLEAELQ